MVRPSVSAALLLISNSRSIHSPQLARSLQSESPSCTFPHRQTMPVGAHYVIVDLQRLTDMVWDE